MTGVRTRRIWHAEVEALGDALEGAGAWQAALRVRIAHREALSRRPDGSVFDYRPTPEDEGPLGVALDALRGYRRASRLLGHRRRASAGAADDDDGGDAGAELR